MPASHSNGPPTCTLRHPASWALPNGSDTLLGLPWISGPRPYFVWSVKWVLRYWPSDTKIQKPVCARCAESFGQPCQTWHPCLWMDKLQMENRVLWKCFQAPCFCARDQCQACWMGLPRVAWVRLNRLRTGVGRFHSSMHKWGLAPSPNCECGAFEQTADHVLTACPIHRAPHGARGLTVLDDKTRCWLNDITASIWSRQYSSLG